MRNYVAIPHEYLEEMEELNDEEFGSLIRGVLRYSVNGEVVEPVGNAKFYARRVMMQEDRFRASYDELATKRSEAGKKAAQVRWDKEMRSHAIACNTNLNNTKQNYTTPILGGASGVCLMTSGEKSVEKYPFGEWGSAP